MLLFLMIVATSILFLPGITVQKARQSAWIASLFASLAGFITLWCAAKLSQRFPRSTLPQYSEIILGKTVGKVFAGAYVLFFFTVNVLVIREFTEFLSYAVLAGTPWIVLNTAIVLVSGYAALGGIEVIARMTQFVLPLYVAISVAILALGIPNIDLERLLPLFEGGVRPIMEGAFVPASWFGEIVVLVMLLPVVNKPREVKRKVVWALLAAAVFLTAEIIITLATFGPDLTGNLLFPLLWLTKSFEFKNYFQRLEGFILPLWIMAIVVKSALFYFVSCKAVAQVLGLKSYKSALYTMVPVQIIAPAFLAGNTMMLTKILAKYWPPFGLLFEVVLPLLLLLVAVVRKKREGAPR